MHHRPRPSYGRLLAATLALTGISQANDWTNWRGPLQNGVSLEHYTKAGKLDGSPIFTNVTTDPTEVATAAGMYAVADSDGKAQVVLFTDSAYQICTTKTNAEKAAIEKCKDCKVLGIEDTPLGEVSTRMPQLTTTLKSKYGDKWNYSVGINDLYFDFMAPSLQAAGIPGDGLPKV